MLVHSFATIFLKSNSISSWYCGSRGGARRVRFSPLFWVKKTYRRRKIRQGKQNKTTLPPLAQGLNPPPGKTPREMSAELSQIQSTFHFSPYIGHHVTYLQSVNGKRKGKAKSVRPPSPPVHPYPFQSPLSLLFHSFYARHID